MDLRSWSRRGLVTIVAGAALLGGSGVALAAPVLHPAGAQSGHHHATPAIRPAPDQYNPVPSRAAEPPPSVLRIPSIGVDAPVEAVGVTADYSMATPSQTSKTGWYSQGSVPGAPGDAVIDGHLDTEAGGPAVFSRLSQLRAGDPVIVVLADGREARFTVNRIANVPYMSRPAGLFQTDGPPRLTLITCAGAWDALRGVYADRLVVDATPSTG